MTKQQYIQSRPDLLNNWNNAMLYMQNPNDPRWANDPNVAGIAEYGTLDQYLQANYGNTPFEAEPASPPPAPNSGAGTGDWTDLVNQNPTPPPTSTPTVTTPTVTANGGNYNQTQNANQAGQFATVGNSTQQSKQTSGQTGTQSSAGTQSQNQQMDSGQSTTTNQQLSGTQASNINQQTSNTGTSTTNQNVGTSGTQTTTGADTTTGRDVQSTNQTATQNAIDALGFGALLRNQAGTVQANDAARSGFLQDVMTTGGSGFNAQIDQAVRQALTGPQTTGAGDSARARMASYAASDVARNNLSQRLAAAEQLSGPTGLANLSTAANPYIGTSNTTTGTNTADTNRTTNSAATTNSNQNQNVFGRTQTDQRENVSGSTLTNQNQNTAGMTNTSGWQNLVNNMTSANTGVSSQSGWQNLLAQSAENQSGSTSAASSQAGAGNIPEGQPVKTGGCVLCTAGIELKFWKLHRVLRKVIGYKLGPGWNRFRLAARGYFAVFGPFANWLLDHPDVAKVLAPLARKVVYEELRVSGRKLSFRLDAWLTHWIGDTFCRFVGLFPVAGYVKETRILDIARREGILFEVQS